MNRTKFEAFALAALLAGCGGGDVAEPAKATPQEVGAALRARALAVSAASISPDDVARQLIDWAEAHPVYGPQYFPTHEPTVFDAPFHYRYYPSTKVYLGVASGGNPIYQDGVWVMGGEFGNAPLYVGPVTKFITPVGEPGTGANNGCFDLALEVTPGTRTVLTYRYSGSMTGTDTIDTLVGHTTTFNGSSAQEVESKTTGVHTSAEGSTEVEREVKSYLRRTGDAELTHFGSVAKSTTALGQFSLKSTSTTTYVPPFVDKLYALAIGGSYTYTQTGSITTVQDPFLPGLPPTTTTSAFSDTTTVKYVGRESVTVPAGAYNTCRFETTVTGSSEVTTSWVIVGKGIPAKSVSVDGTKTVTMEATSITLNGQGL